MADSGDQGAWTRSDSRTAGVTLHHSSCSAGSGHFSFTDLQTVRVGGMAPPERKKKKKRNSWLAAATCVAYLSELPLSQRGDVRALSQALRRAISRMGLGSGGRT